MKIAVCDDIDKDRQLVVSMLNKIIPDAITDEYNNGSELVKNHIKDKYDLIILDIIMPDMSGMKAAEHIRADDDETGLQINFTTTDNGDGTLTVDMGDGDVATIAAADAQTVVEAMDVIAAETTDVTAEYIASLQ